MKIVLVISLPSRASHLSEAAQKRGGAGGGECEVPLCRPRRPCSHCTLEERWLRPPQGQVTHSGTRVIRPSHRSITSLVQLFVFVIFFWQIWNPRRPHFEYSSSDVRGRGLLHLCGGKHGRKVGSVRHAHRSRSAQSTILTRRVVAAILSLLFFKDFLLKTPSSSLSEGETPSCSVRGGDVHLAFYPDLVFSIVPRGAVPL